jgi:DNA invertase Pin-like site-specific DNA recombinase
MTKIIAYIRTSTDKQELNNQKLTILEYAQKNNLKINEFVKTTQKGGLAIVTLNRVMIHFYAKAVNL